MGIHPYDAARGSRDAEDGIRGRARAPRSRPWSGADSETEAEGRPSFLRCRLTWVLTYRSLLSGIPASGPPLGVKAVLGGAAGEEEG